MDYFSVARRPTINYNPKQTNNYTDIYISMFGRLLYLEFQFSLFTRFLCSEYLINLYLSWTNSLIFLKFSTFFDFHYLLILLFGKRYIVSDLLYAFWLSIVWLVEGHNFILINVVINPHTLWFKFSTTYCLDRLLNNIENRLKLSI